MAKRKNYAEDVRNILLREIESDDEISEVDESSEEDCIPTPVKTDGDDDASRSSYSSELEMEEPATKRPARGRGQIRGRTGRVASSSSW